MASACFSSQRISALRVCGASSAGRFNGGVTLLLLLWAAALAPSNRVLAADESLNTAKFNCCYRVTGVAANDVLNVRAEPGRTDTLVGEIPRNATGIGVAQCMRVRPSNATWCLVQYQGIVGWIAAQFITQ